MTENGSDTGLDSTGAVVTTPQGTGLRIRTSRPPGRRLVRRAPVPSGSGFSTGTSITVPASPGGSQNTVTVTYSDSIVTGVIEVCKAIVTGSGLCGSWQFTITGANGFSQVVSVPVGDLQLAGDGACRAREGAGDRRCG